MYRGARSTSLLPSALSSAGAGVEPARPLLQRSVRLSFYRSPTDALSMYRILD